MSYAVMKAIEYALPNLTLSNDELADAFPEWSIEKIEAKTGIKNRHIADVNEYASDFAVSSAQKLFALHNVFPSDIDFILYCTQSPDYVLPTTACILQERLECSSAVGALDYNLGCSGYVYGLAMAKGLIETKQAKNVLLLTADTYSKYISSDDRTVKTIFGDGASATWVGSDANSMSIFPVAFGTDGRGAEHLIVRNSGLKKSDSHTKKLQMNGPEIFRFTLDVVPDIVQKALEQANIQQEQIDLYVFHQANQYMLDFLRKKMNIPTSKFVLELSEVGNTVSSSIPIALSEALKKKESRKYKYVMLVGFGVGYSWGAVVVDLEAMSKGL